MNLDNDSMFMNDLFGDGLANDPVLETQDRVAELTRSGSAEFDMPQSPESLLWGGGESGLTTGGPNAPSNGEQAMRMPSQSGSGGRSQQAPKPPLPGAGSSRSRRGSVAQSTTSASATALEDSSSAETSADFPGAQAGSDSQNGGIKSADASAGMRGGAAMGNQVAAAPPPSLDAAGSGAWACCCGARVAVLARGAGRWVWRHGAAGHSAGAAREVAPSLPASQVRLVPGQCFFKAKNKSGTGSTRKQCDQGRAVGL
jgi:hypothetical protein